MLNVYLLNKPFLTLEHNSHCLRIYTKYMSRLKSEAKFTLNYSDD